MPYYIDKKQPLLGDYDIEYHAESGYRWVWNEVAKGETYTDYGKYRSSESEALRDAADDWESNGNSSNRRFAGMLRGLAARKDSHALPG